MPADASKSNDAAAHPQSQRADRHDHKAKIAARILVRCETERRADAGNQNDKPVEPAKQRYEAYNGKDEGDKSEEECNDVSHAAFVTAFAVCGKHTETCFAEQC